MSVRNPPVLVPTSGQELIGKVKAGQGATLLVLSDSTGDAAGEWPDLLIRAYATANPLVTVQSSTWVDGGAAYPAFTQIQAGDGSHGTLSLYNCSVASVGRPAYFLAPYFDAMVAAVQPDLIIISLGHNEASAVAEPFWRDELLALTESVMMAVPDAEIITLSQNPRTDGSATQQSQRRWITQYVSNIRGYGFIDTYRLFLNGDGSVNTALLQPDGIHPNSTGQQAMFADIWRRLQYTPGGIGLVSRQPSSFLRPASATVPLLNANMATFAPPAAPTSWTASGAPVFAQDAVNYEGTNGYSVSMTSGGGAVTYIEQAITGNAIRPLLGKLLVFCARILVPAGQNSNVGRVHMRTTGGVNTISLNSVAKTVGQGAFRYQLISGRVDASAGTVTFRVYCENGTAGGNMRLDRCSVAVGVLPTDLQ